MLPPASDPFYARLGIFVTSLVRRRFANSGAPWSWKPPRRGGKPLMDTGRLRDSIGHLVRSLGRAVQVAVGTYLIYARIHHYGGVIRPVRARMLFIPLTAKGRRIGPRPLGERSTRMVDAKGREKFKPLLKRGVDFVLKLSVRIPARPYLRMSADDKEAIRAFVRRELQGRLK